MNFYCDVLVVPLVPVAGVDDAAGGFAVAAPLVVEDVSSDGFAEPRIV